MWRKYGFFGIISLAISLLYTKLFFSNTRLVRIPIDVRNRRFISLGNGFTSGFGCRLEAYPQSERKDKILVVGRDVEINDYVHIASGELVTIGDNVLIASKVFITDISHGNYQGNSCDNPFSIPKQRALNTRPVVIKDNVWIGESVCILPGVTIGEGCVIGSLSVVTKSIPPYSIAVGIPAKVIKKFDVYENVWKSV